MQVLWFIILITYNLISDINECLINTDNCGDLMCRNTMGSFICECGVGFDRVGDECIGNIYRNKKND